MTLDSLPGQLDELYAAVMHWRFDGEGLQPADDWSAKEAAEFFTDLYAFAAEVFHMKLRMNAGRGVTYVPQETGWLTRKEAIVLLGSLIALLDVELIWSFRDTTRREDVLIRELELLQAGLTGMVYRQFAYEESVTADQLVFF
ncbi:MAG: hypothetical protein JKY70_18890 [Mucilaginibacter sp.]|nr:hypothetical protein [Mucilaginibacter sp.]